jgi:hypothetical protein
MEELGRGKKRGRWSWDLGIGAVLVVCFLHCVEKKKWEGRVVVITNEIY